MPIVSNWIAKYKVCVVEELEEAKAGGSGKGGKILKICTAKVGVTDEGDPETITVVTSAPNVRLKSRLVVAPVGSTVLGPAGEGMPIERTSVGGVMSEGMFCDSRMLGWEGGSVGIAVQIDESIPIGSPPPAFKPRPINKKDAEPLPESNVEGLFKKKLTKEEKKALAKKKREAKKAARLAKKGASNGANGEDYDHSESHSEAVDDIITQTADTSLDEE